MKTLIMAISREHDQFAFLFLRNTNFSTVKRVLLLQKIFIYLTVLSLRCFVQAFSAGSARVSCCGGFFPSGAQVLWRESFRICGIQAPELRLNSCGSRAQVLHVMWDLPRSGTEPESPALAGRFFTTAPPRKSLETCITFIIRKN